MIIIGTNNIAAAYVGATAVEKAYIGNNQIYPNTSLGLSASELQFAAAGQSQTLNVVLADNASWQVTAPDNWQVSPLSGTGPGTITVTAANNTSTNTRSGTLTLSSEQHTVSCALTQEAGAKVFSEVTISAFSYPDILAKGGSVAPKLNYTQAWTWNAVAGSGGNITSGATVVYAGNAVDTKGNVTALSKELVISDRSKVTTASITVTLNGKSTTAQADIYQEANTRTLTSVEIRQNGGGADLTTQFSAAGGSGYYAPYGTYTYNSGSTKWVELETQTSLSSWSVDQSWITLSAHPTYGWTVIAKAENRGTSAGSQRTATLKLSVGSLSDSVVLTQAANNVERVAITTGGGVDDPLQTQFSAAGDAYVAAAWAYYTSNAKQEIQDVTFDNWSINGSGFTMEEDPNYPYAVDIGAENRGTTVGPERSVTISFEYSGKADSITLTQEANEQKQTACSIEIDHDYQDPLGYNNTNVPAAGGRVCIVGVRHYAYTSGATNQNEYDSFTLNSNQSWCVADDASNLTISTRGTVTGSDRSATVYWQDGTFKSNEMSITQKANSVASYGIPTGRTLSVTDIPAKGGTISGGTLGGTITQTRTFSSGSSDTITNPTVTSSSYSAGVYNGSLGNTVVPRTKIGTLTYSYVCNGKTGSVSADVYQEANNETSITYGTPVVSLSVSDIPASGGTVSSGTVTYTQTRVQNYTSGGTKGLSNVTSGGSISYSTAISANSKGTSISNRTKVGTLTATVTLNGQKGSGLADVYQAANGRYDKRTVLHFDNFEGPTSKTVSAAGAEIHLSIELIRGFTSGAEGDSVDVTNNSLSSITVSGTGFSISPNDKGLLIVASRGTTVGSARTGSLKATWNGLTSPESICTQEANSATYGAVSISGGSVSVIPASGGTVSSMSGISASQTVSFSSGDSRPGSVSISYSSAVSASSKGTSISNQTSVGTLTATATGEGPQTATKALTVYQAGNYVTAIKGSVGTFSYPNISAGATSATPNLSAGFGVQFTFSSGGTSSSTPSSTYGSLTVSDSFKLSASQNGFTAVNADSGVLTATNRGTTPGDARTSGTVTRTLTATWTPTSSYNTAGTKTSTWSTTATCTQEANILTWNTPTISRATPVSIAANGGTNNVATGLTYSQTGQYSSGSPASANSGGTLSYAVKTAKTGFSLSGSTVTATNNTSTSARNGFVVRITLTLNGKTATKDITYNQTAGSKVYGTPSVSLSYPTVAYNVTVADPTVSYSQVWTWNGVSGSGGTITSGGYISYTGTGGTSYPTNTVSGRITWGTNSSTSARSITVTATVTLNGVKGTGSATAKQSGYTGPVDIYITTSFNYATSQIQINFSSAPQDTFFIKFMGYDQFGGMWEYVTGITPSPTTSILFSPPGYSITNQFGIEGVGATEYTLSNMSPYETSNARYYWSSGMITMV